MFKIKAEKRIRPRTFSNNAVLEVPEGTILKVTKSFSNNGDIIIRTNHEDKLKPFRTMLIADHPSKIPRYHIGLYWANDLGGYEFEEVLDRTQYNFEDYYGVLALEKLESL